jgi:hypothetical protein
VSDDLRAYDWFIGPEDVSSVDLDKLLGKRAGAFCVRVSPQTGQMVLSWVRSGTIMHTPIWATKTGYDLPGESFPSVLAAVTSWRPLLEARAEFLDCGSGEDLGQFGWFHGQLSRNEAEALVSSAGEGAFLVRFKLEPGSPRPLVMSMMLDGTVVHMLFEPCNAGYAILGVDGITTVHASMRAAIAHAAENKWHPSGILRPVLRRSPL